LVYHKSEPKESWKQSFGSNQPTFISPKAAVRKGDRVVVRTSDGKVMGKIMHKQSAGKLELASFTNDQETITST
jgi:phage repressor protein C with HTH and peptisase S24 domain